MGGNNIRNVGSCFCFSGYDFHTPDTVCSCQKNNKTTKENGGKNKNE